MYSRKDDCRHGQTVLSRLDHRLEWNSFAEVQRMCANCLTNTRSRPSKLRTRFLSMLSSPFFPRRLTVHQFRCFCGCCSCLGLIDLCVCRSRWLASVLFIHPEVFCKSFIVFQKKTSRELCNSHGAWQLWRVASLAEMRLRHGDWSPCALSLVRRL